MFRDSVVRIITFCDTISSGFTKPQEHTDGEMTP